jgi:hypothetical protein
MKHRRRREAAVADEALTVASATECTGLMPALPEDEAQDAAEAALYDIHEAVDSTR